MKYHYAIIDKVGQCYAIYNTTNHVCDPYHIPIENDNSMKYLSKYYWPVLDFADCDTDFTGAWYLDAKHTIKEVSL